MEGRPYKAPLFITRPASPARPPLSLSSPMSMSDNTVCLFAPLAALLSLAQVTSLEPLVPVAGGRGAALRHQITRLHHILFLPPPPPRASHLYAAPP